MTSVLASAFAQGFTADQVIQYLVRHSPQYARQIASATGVGYTPKQILQYITKNNPKERAAATEYEEIRNKDQQNRTNANKAVIGGALAATAVPIAASAGSAALSRALPQTMRNQAPQIANAMGSDGLNPNTSSAPTAPIMPQASSNQIPSQQPPIDLGNANIQQPVDIEQPKQNSSIVDKLYSGFEKGRDKGFDFESDAFLKVAKRMKSTGEIRSKEDFEKFFNLFDAKKNEGKDLPTALKEASIEFDTQKLSPTEQPKEDDDKLGFKGAFDTLKGDTISNKLYEGILKSLQEGKDTFAGVKEPLLQAAKPAFDAGQIKSVDDLKRFQEFYAKTTSNKSQEQPSMEPPSAQLDEAKEIERPKIEKNSVVSSPDGVGEVREIRGDKALVEIDGKLKKVNVGDLEPPLYTDDDIADAYDRLMAIIPEKERSGFISWAGYDENTNELGFIPRGGKYEVITDISPEEAKMIKEGTGTARTNGEVREGLWVAGGETRGGVISQIIHDRRRKKEAEEKKQGKFDFGLPKPEKEDRGMKPQFDEMAYARNLSRARDKRAKDEERARKKKEKDEAKKRKK